MYYATGGGHSKINAETRLYKHYDQVRKLHIMLKQGRYANDRSGVPLIENCDLLIESVRADAAPQPFREACHLKGANSPFAEPTKIYKKRVSNVVERP